MSDKEKLVQMLLRCSMSTGHADTMDDLIELRQKNADLVAALHTISSVDASIVIPHSGWDSMTPKDWYKSGLRDGAMAARDGAMAVRDGRTIK